MEVESSKYRTRSRQHARGPVVGLGLGRVGGEGELTVSAVSALVYSTNVSSIV